MNSPHDIQSRHQSYISSIDGQELSDIPYSNEHLSLQQNRVQRRSDCQEQRSSEEIKPFHQVIFDHQKVGRDSRKHPSLITVSIATAEDEKATNLSAETIPNHVQSNISSELKSTQQSANLYVSNIDGSNDIAGKGEVIAQKKLQKLKTSLMVALTSTAWTYYHSFVLAGPGISYVLITLVPLQFFHIDYDVAFKHYLAFGWFSLLILYKTVWFICLMMFGIHPRDKRILLTMLFFYAIHVGLFTIRSILSLPFLAPIFYSIAFPYFYFATKLSSKGPPHSRNSDAIECFTIIISDGTPGLVFKCVSIFLIFFHLVTFFLMPKLDSDDVWLRIILRSIVVPLLLSISDFFQSTLVMRKSFKQMKYRLVAFNLTSVIGAGILRLMISTSSSIQDLIFISISSSLIEMVLRLTYFSRMVLSIKVRMWVYASAKRLWNTRRMATIPVESIPASDMQTVESHHLDDSITAIISRSDFSKFSIKKNSEFQRWMMQWRRCRVDIVRGCEIQLALCLPLFLWLYHPMRQYTTLKTIPNPSLFMLSLVIQILAEIVSDFLSYLFDHYIYDVDVSNNPRFRDFRLNLDVKRQFFSFLVISTSVYLSSIPFHLAQEDWPGHD